MNALAGNDGVVDLGILWDGSANRNTDLCRRDGYDRIVIQQGFKLSDFLLNLRGFFVLLVALLASLCFEFFEFG